MSYEEFGKISRDHNWGDCPGVEFWEDIEALYTNTPVEFSKELVAYIYWKQTGRFEKLVDLMKKLWKECESVGNGAKWLLPNVCADSRKLIELAQKTVEDFGKEAR